jgi:hypothetical protein
MYGPPRGVKQNLGEAGSNLQKCIRPTCGSSGESILTVSGAGSEAAEKMRARFADQKGNTTR